MGHVTKPSGRIVLETPQDFVTRCAKKLLHGDYWQVDAAALSTNKKAIEYFGPDHDDPNRRDALDADWGRSFTRVWLNPPYGRGVTGEWAEYAKEQAFRSRVLVCGLFPGDSRGARWWHYHVLKGAAEVWDVKGRISFLEDGVPQRGNQINSVVVVWLPCLASKYDYPLLNSIEAEV